MIRSAIAGILALFAVAQAAAQTFPTVPSQTVIGRLGLPGTTGPSQAIPFATLNSNLLNSMCATSGAFPIYNATTGLWVCSTAGGTGLRATLNGGPLTISPTAATSTQGLVVNQTGPTSGATVGDASSGCWGASPSLLYNSICINGEGANVTGTPPAYTYGLNVGLLTGGADSTGTKEAGSFYLYKTTASSPATARDHIALGSTAIADSGDGGTGTGIGNSKGTLFATGFRATARSGATNLFEVSGGEVDCSINTGASASYRFCWNLVSGGNVAGAVLDAGLVLGSVGQAFNNGILFANANGSQPVATTGCAICSTGSATILSAIDFSSYTISSYLIRGPHSYLDGAGNGLFETSVVVGKTGTGSGSVAFLGSTSGTATVVASATAGTPTLTLPTASGTFTTSGASLTANQLIIGSGSQAMQALGSLGTTITVLHGNAGGAPSFGAVVSADLNITTTSCTNQVVTAISSGGVGTCSNTPLTSANFANPTASIGLSAVNGSATTAMRSDAAPALSQSIVPTWTGVHTHTPSQAANTSADGIALADTTAATAGNQQYSPRLRLTGQGWKTNATAASQQADWIIENVPVQGAANPDSYLKFSSQINGGGYTELFSFRNSVNSAQTTFFINNATASQFQMAVGGTAIGVHYVDTTQYIFGALTAIPVKVYTSNTERARFFDSGCFALGTTTDCGAGNISANKAVQTGAVAVGSLPTCNAAAKAQRYFVTDANATFTAGIGAVVAAGGANNVPVTCDGTNWRIGANDNFIPTERAA